MHPNPNNFGAANGFQAHVKAKHSLCKAHPATSLVAPGPEMTCLNPLHLQSDIIGSILREISLSLNRLVAVKGMSGEGYNDAFLSHNKRQPGLQQEI